MKKIIQMFIILCGVFICVGVNAEVKADYIDVNNTINVSHVSLNQEHVFAKSNNENVSKDDICSPLGALRKDLNGIFNIMKILAPILVVVMSAYDFVKALAGKADDEIKKVFKKFLKRLVFVMILFFLPTLLDFFLGLVDSGYSTCINS